MIQDNRVCASVQMRRTKSAAGPGRASAALCPAHAAIRLPLCRRLVESAAMASRFVALGHDGICSGALGISRRSKGGHTCEPRYFAIR